MGENNLGTIVEWIMAQKGVNIGIQMSNYTYPLSEYVLQTEFSRGWIVLKFTKFVGDTNEFTIEHIARYLTEAGDIENNENLSLRCFPSSLKKRPLHVYNAPCPFHQ